MDPSQQVKKQKPHVVCIPLPAQGHINPMMQLAKLHSRGFFDTFVNTHFTHSRLLTSQALDSFDCLEGFHFETISDGLSLPDREPAMQDLRAVCESTREKCVVPFHDLITKLNRSSNEPPVSCIVSDGTMSFTLQIAEELGILEVVFWPAAACGFIAFLHYRKLIRRGLVQLKDESCINNGYLDTTNDWIPGMREIQLKDLPSFIRTTDPDNIFLNFLADEAQNAFKASAFIFNTFRQFGT